MSQLRPRGAVASAVMLALASAAAAAQEGVVLAEITVTAQKRVELLQDVPVAVSAVSGVKIAEAGILKIEDLKNYVPTLFMTETAIGNNIAIRGIFSGVNPGFEQSVGTYVDGVYRGRPQQTRAPFLDLERVEVLRGAQSILFGKNSVAGALNITTARPTSEFSGYLTALYEPRYDEQEITGVLSGPFSDRFRGRVAARWREADGHVHNEISGSEDPSREEKTARVWLEMDVSDRMTAALKYERGEFDVVGRQIEITTEIPRAGAPSQTNPFGGRTLAQIFTLFGAPSAVLNNTPDFVRTSNGDFSNNESDEAALILNWNLDGKTFTSVTAMSKYEFSELCDCDFTGANVFSVTLAEDFDQVSQEFRLTSDTGGKFEYILGAYYEKADLTYQDSIQVNSASVLVPALNGNPAFCPPGSVPPFTPSAGAPLCGTAGTMIANTASPRLFRQDAKSYSAFAELTWNMTEDFRTTLGLRYAKDEKDASRSLRFANLATGAPLSGTQAVLGPIVYAAAFNVRPHSLSGSRDENQLLPSVTFEWDASDNTMLYMSWRQGAKAGGFDARSNNPAAPPALRCTNPPANNIPAGCLPASGIGSFQYEEEKSTNLEFGAKMSLGGKFELNAAFYMTDFEDLQVSTFDGRLGFNVQNAGEADIRGLELDMRWQATRNLMLSASLAYTDFEFKDYFGQCISGQAPDAPDGINCNYKGKTNEYVADWVGTLAADYRRPIFNSLEFRLGFDVYYTDEYFVNPTLDPRQKQKAYEKVNARMGVGDQDGRWSLSLIGKNLFNEMIFPYGNDTPLASTFGVFSAWRFSEPGSSLALQGTIRF